jgi:hypothetical protein
MRSATPLALIALLSIPVPAAVHAQACAAPKFESLAAVAGDQKPATLVQTQDLVRIGIPTSIKQVVTGSHDKGGVSFIYPDGSTISFTVETESMLRPQTKTKPGPFYGNAFTGATAEGCKFAKAWRLESAEYRVALRKGTLAVFAYGSASEHQFVAVLKEKPAVVVHGLASNMSRSAFDQIISSIEPL